MTDHERFIEAVAAEPDDDGPRLVYADWLDERGDPRGRFVRTQVELARLPEDDPRRAPLEEVQARLLLRHEQRWLGELDDLLPAEHCGAEFERGFVADVTFWGREGARHLLASAGRLFRRAPVERVRLRPLGGVGRALLPWERPPPPLVDRLTSDELTELVGVPQLARLRLLDFGPNLLADPEGNKTALLVASNLLGDGGARRLAECPWLANLQALILDDNHIGDTGVTWLLRSPHFSRLQRLDLQRNLLSGQMKQELQRRFGGGVLL